MLEPIREAKIAEPASPLQYRSGIDDRKDYKPAQQVDGAPVRLGLFLIAVPMGLLVAAILHIFLVALLISREVTPLICGVLHLGVVLLECALASKIGEGTETRSTFFIQGILGGAMLVSGFLAIVFFAQYWNGM